MQNVFCSFWFPLCGLVNIRSKIMRNVLQRGKSYCVGKCVLSVASIDFALQRIHKAGGFIAHLLRLHRVKAFKVPTQGSQQCLALQCSCWHLDCKATNIKIITLNS